VFIAPVRAIDIARIIPARIWFGCAAADRDVDLKAMRAGGIDVVAIHNHMTDESPRILFLHYWGVGPTETLAKTLRAALDKTKHDPPAP
jgi:hypothetical protein